MSTHRRHPYACLREIGFLFPEELEFSFYFHSILFLCFLQLFIHSISFLTLSYLSPNLSITLSSTSLLNSSATISKFSFLEQARYLDYSGERSLPGLFRRAFILKSCYLDYSGEHSLPGFLQASFSHSVSLPGLYRRVFSFISGGLTQVF